MWRSVGNCGRPPNDQSRRFAIVAITLTLGVWIVLPLLVTLSLAIVGYWPTERSGRLRDYFVAMRSSQVRTMSRISVNEPRFGLEE